MILQPSPLSSKQFSFRRNQFTAMISDFGRLFSLGQVYDDACDEGFTIISERTGKSAVFTLYQEIRHNEEFCGWEFHCVTPGLTHLKAVIFND